MKSLENTTNLTSYNKWLNSGEKLHSRFFEFDVAKKSSAFPILAVKEMHSTPKQFNSDYLEIGVDDWDQKICIYTGDTKAKNGVFVFTFNLYPEFCIYDQNGDEVEYSTQDALDQSGGDCKYGFALITKTFDDFVASDESSYNKWLNSGEKLNNKYFGIDEDGSISVKEMHRHPKQFNSDYLEIGITDSNEKICIYTGDRKAKNGVFVFTDMLDEESCWYNQDGTPAESADREIIDRCGGGYQYGFELVAKNFETFLNISY